MAKTRKPSRMQEMLDRYGPAALITWFTIFFSTIGLFYALLTIGVDLDSLVLRVASWWGSDGSVWAERSASAGALGLAYLAAQVVKPLRIGLFVVLTPVVARFMGRKESPPAEAAPDTVASEAAPSDEDGSAESS
jgi:hypothetical protein